MKESWRACKSLSLMRLIIGLLVAPFPVAGALGLIGMDFDYLSRTFMVWFIVTGIAYLASACFFRGRIGRVGCLIAGAAAGTTWPFGAIGLFSISPPFLSSLLGFPAVAHSPSELFAYQLTKPGALAGGIFGCLAGFFAGWLLWRLGVQPAPAPHQEDFEEVFE
jgi:hypothetical protein